MQKNLNDIIPPSRRRAMEGGDIQPSHTSTATPPPPPERPSYARPLSQRPKRSFPVGTAIVGLVVILLCVVALFMFSGAEVDVTATENKTAVAGEFIATGSGGDLPFEILTVEKVAGTEVESEGTETVNQSAQGTITIENKQDVPQQLIKNTRFETPDGLIFRIRDSVTVPASKNGAPGTLDTTVYADATGESYNVGPTTFTLPGLKGGATFTQVTARSKEAMKGGFAGPRPSVKAATRETKGQEIRTKLGADIDAAIREAVPPGYLLIPGASRVVYEPQPDQASSGNKVQLSEKAVATVVVFPKDALARAIAYQVVGSYAGQPVTVEDASTLSLTPVGDLPVPGTAEFAFSLTGNATILWTVELSKIASAVAGKTAEGAQAVLSGYPEIEEASLVLRPFWNRSFPEDPAKIDVSVKNAPKTP